jgi:outer membrane protein assembly factor BamB
MTAEEFLDQLTKKDLVSAKVIDALRRQVAAADKPISNERIVKLLEAKGYVTAAQAARLLQESESSRATRTRKEGAPAEDEGDLFELVPLDESPVEDQGPPIPRVAPLVPSNEALLPDDAALVPESRPVAPDATAEPTMADLLANTMTDVPATSNWERDIGGSRRGLARWLPIGRRRSAAGQRRQADNRWDSPLLLIGGGALILLVLVGGTLLYLINRGSGDTLLKMAEDAYREGSYTQAIAKYSRFLERYPRHANGSLAKVHRGLAQLRQALHSSRDGSQQLATAKTVLKEIEAEDDFAEARAELAAILPEIAAGLAEQARASSAAAEARQNVDLANEALTLVMNTNYVPSSLRPSRRVQQIRTTLDLVLRDLTRDQSFAAALAEIESAVATGDTRKAYAIRAELLKSYPSLARSKALDKVVLEITRAEKANVKMVQETLTAVRDDLLPSAVSLAARQGPAASGQAGTPVLVAVDGAVNAFDAATGQLLWRRPVGIDLRGTPAAVAGPDGKTALLVDTTRHELVCVELASGRLKWRFPVGERFAAPCLMKNRILVAAASGKLFVLDPTSGQSTEHLVIPQGLRTSPVCAPQLGLVYQLGEHSSLYVLSAADLRCRQVFYLGHAKGSVAVAPVVVLKRLVVVENRGLAAATLHVLAYGKGPAEGAGNGAAGDQAEENAESRAAMEGPELTIAAQVRLAGHVLTPPVVAGRLLAVATDRGQVKLFEVASGDALEPVAERSPAGKESHIRYPLLHNGSLWVAGTKLTKYQIQPQAGQLTPQGIERTYGGDAFDYPLRRSGNWLISVRRRAGHDGATVAATAIDSGQQIWESRIGMRPAAAPQVDAAAEAVTLVTTDGMLFQLDKAAFQHAVADQPRYPSAPPDEVPYLSQRILLGGQRAAYASTRGGRDVLVCDLNQARASQPLKWLRLADDLACAPGAFGAGLLTPSGHGQVGWINAESAAPIAEAFQPTLQQASMPAWQPPRAVGPGAREFIVADSLGKLYRVGVKDQPTRHLVTLAKSDELAEQIIAPPVVVGKTVFAATAAGHLLPFTLSELKPAAAIELGGRVRWGPRPIGGYLLLTTEADELMSIDQRRKVVWRVKLPYGPLAGAPYATDKQIVLAASSGTLWQIDATTGKELSRVGAGQPLGSGAVPFGRKWIVAATHGAVVTLALPDQK